MPSKPRAEYEIRAKDESAAGWRSALSTAHSNANKLKSTIGTAFGGVLSVQLFTSQISKAIEFGDEIGKLAVKMGATTTATQELVAVARKFDIEMSSLATSFRKMQVGISQATTGNKEMLETLGALGLKIEDIRRLQPDQQFEVIADAISRLKDPADRTRAAVALFGRAGADLLPMFEAGSEGIRKARMEVKEFGQVLSDIEIKKLQEADDAIKVLSATWDTFWRKIAVGTVQYGQMIVGATQQLKDFATQQGMIATAARLTFSSLPFVGPLLMGAEVQSHIDAANDYTRGGGSRRGRPPTPAPAPGFGVTATQSDAFTPEMRAAIRAADSWRALVDDVDSGIGKGIIDSNEAIGQSFEDLQEPILQTKDTMTVFADEAARNMQDAFADFLFDPFEDGLKGMLRGFADIIRQMVVQAASAKIFEALGGVSGLGNILGSLFGGGGKSGGVGLGAFLDAFSVPAYASGTDFVPRDQLAYVHRGEQIIPAGRDSRSGGMSFAPVINIDARGATPDAIKLLPSFAKQISDQVEARVVQRLRRNWYGTGRG